MLFVPGGTQFIPMIGPSMFLPDPAGAIRTHAVRFVPETARSRKADELVRARSPGKYKGAGRLSTLLDIDFVLFFA